MTRAVAGRQEATGLPLLQSYWNRSQMPLTCLLFVSPMVVLYELGTHLFARDAVHHQELRIVAFLKLQQFFAFFGASQQYLPALSVASILLAWHIARRDPWKLELGVAVAMVLECILLCLPLFVMGVMVDRLFPLHTGIGNGPARLIFPLGAGVYEELVFRLIGFTFLSFVLVDVFRMSKRYATPLIVCVCAVLFALHHCWGIGERFDWHALLFRTGAGIYFGLVFLSRGYGITAGSHATYDIINEVVRALF
jgi:membrane protease YdiL (CAAX protease family)